MNKTTQSNKRRRIERVRHLGEKILICDPAFHDLPSALFMLFGPSSDNAEPVMFSEERLIVSKPQKQSAEEHPRLLNVIFRRRRLLQFKCNIDPVTVKMGSKIRATDDSIWKALEKHRLCERVVHIVSEFQVFSDLIVVANFGSVLI